MGPRQTCFCDIAPDITALPVFHKMPSITMPKDFYGKLPESVGIGLFSTRPMLIEHVNKMSADVLIPANIAVFGSKTATGVMLEPSEFERVWNDGFLKLRYVGPALRPRQHESPPRIHEPIFDPSEMTTTSTAAASPDEIMRHVHAKLVKLGIVQDSSSPRPRWTDEKLRNAIVRTRDPGSTYTPSPAVELRDKDVPRGYERLNYHGHLTHYNTPWEMLSF